MSSDRQRSPFEGDGRGDRKGDETLHIELVGIRGGHGASTVAAATALILGAAHAHVALDASEPDSMAAMLGCSTPGSRPTILTGTVEIAAPATWTRSEGPRVVVTDLGRHGSPGGGSVKAVAALRVGVLRGPCYLALRTLVAADTVDWAGLVLCAEAGRALDRRDVEDIAGLAVLATVDVTPAVARTLDAGLAVSRLPKMREFAQLRRWLTSPDSRPSIGPDQAAPDAVAFRPEPVEKTCTDRPLLAERQ